MRYRVSIDYIQPSVAKKVDRKKSQGVATTLLDRTRVKDGVWISSGVHANGRSILSTWIEHSITALYMKCSLLYDESST